jgi:peptidoglycan/LPS O-acetylase OafA/YrhL
MIANKRYPSLDGLRAVSISMVFTAHVAGTPISYRGRLQNYIGVQIFFVISGFLITALLLREHEKTGRISLKTFYTRRVLRIFPAFYTALLALTILGRLGIERISWNDLARAATFRANFGEIGWLFAHFWSLSLEEQFYLLWPAALVALGSRRALRVAMLMFVLTPIPFVFIWHAHLRTAESIVTLACGCVLAGLRPRLQVNKTYACLIASQWTSWVAVMGIFSLNYLRVSPLFPLAAPVNASFIAVALDCVITHDSSVLGRFLNCRPVVLVGALSYSLYVWQQIFLNRYGGHSYNVFPLDVLLAILAALLSYHMVEKPFLRLKKRMLSAKDKTHEFTLEPVGPGFEVAS